MSRLNDPEPQITDFFGRLLYYFDFVISRLIDSVALLVGRLLIAALFLPAGVGKAMNLAGTTQMMAGKGLPYPEVFAALAAATEIGGSILLVIGVVPRLTAVLVGGFTLVASLLSHNFWTLADPAARAAQQMQFMKNMAIIGGTMFYFVSGPGLLALGGRRRVVVTERR